MDPVPKSKKSPQQKVIDLTWKLNNMETKVRINEQNIINDRRHVQLMSRNSLDIKKEVREKMGTILTERHDLGKKVSDLEARVKALEKLSGNFVKKGEITALQKFHQNFNYFDKEMTKEEADRVLDEIVSKTEKSSVF